jgi:Uma2 family endonuclease
LTDAKELVMLSHTKTIRRASRTRARLADKRDQSARITYEQFLRRDAEDQHVEWVDGRVVEMPPISTEHDDLAGLLYLILRIWIEAHEAGLLKHDPFQMKTGPGLPGRAPDILFVAKKNLARLKKTHLQGPADLVIEIVSPGSVTIDRGDKYKEYEQGGVREYWLIDPLRKQADFYLLGRDGFYQRIDLTKDGIFQSAVLKGLWLRADWLFRSPLPSAAEILKAWDLP